MSMLFSEVAIQANGWGQQRPGDGRLIIPGSFPAKTDFVIDDQEIRTRKVKEQRSGVAEENFRVEEPNRIEVPNRLG